MSQDHVTLELEYSKVSTPLKLQSVNQPSRRLTVGCGPSQGVSFRVPCGPSITFFARKSTYYLFNVT